MKITCMHMPKMGSIRKTAIKTVLPITLLAGGVPLALNAQNQTNKETVTTVQTNNNQEERKKDPLALLTMALGTIFTTAMVLLPNSKKEPEPEIKTTEKPESDTNIKNEVQQKKVEKITEERNSEETANENSKNAAAAPTELKPDIDPAVNEKKSEDMLKVRKALEELKIPYTVNKEDGLLEVNASTIKNHKKIREKLEGGINLYDYVGTINGNVCIPSYSKLNLGNVHTINGNLTVGGDYSDYYTTCRANKLKHIKGNLLLEFKDNLEAPLLERVDKDCNVIDSYLTSSNLKYVGGDMYICGNYQRYLWDNEHIDLSNLRHAKSITYRVTKPRFSSFLECAKIEEIPWSNGGDYYDEDDDDPSAPW